MQVINIMIIFTREIRKVSNKLIMIERNAHVMILNQDKTKGHLKLSTKQLEAKLGDMLHVQAYQKKKLYISQCDLIVVKACTPFIYKLLVNLKFIFCKQKQMSKC